MRSGWLVGLACLVGLALADLRAEPAARHGIAADLKTYPQATPKQALASALQAVANKRVDYLLAQLADPQWVDARVRTYGGRFPELVRETTDKLDAAAVKQLQRFLADGQCEMNERVAVFRLKEVPDRRVGFKKVGDRWFLEQPYRPR
jgi:hypothetical protein